MKVSSERFNVISFATILFISGAVMQPETVLGQATLSLRARKHNDVVLVGDPNDPVPGASQVNNVNPGDTIEIDMFISNWVGKLCAFGDNFGESCTVDDDCVNGACLDFGGVRGYQINLDSTTYLTADCGNLIPLGWDAPLTNISCLRCSDTGKPCTLPLGSQCPNGNCVPSADVCEEPFPICNEVPSPKCTGTNFDPEVGAFIKETICSDVSDNAGDLCFTDDDCGVGGTCVENEEFIFAGLHPFFALVSTGRLQFYSYGSVLIQAQVPDTGVPRYIGTLILEADLDATGSFTIGINEQFGVSFITDSVGAIKSLVTDPLTINMNTACGFVVGACCNIRVGTCTNNVILDNCQADNLNWVKGNSCSKKSCPDPFIPTISEWGLVILTLLLLITAKVYFGYRHSSHKV